MTTEKESALRAFIGKLLADGLKTLTEPFPETNREFGNLLVALRELPPDDLERSRDRQALPIVRMVRTRCAARNACTTWCTANGATCRSSAVQVEADWYWPALADLAAPC